MPGRQNIGQARSPRTGCRPRMGISGEEAKDLILIVGRNVIVLPPKVDLTVPSDFGPRPPQLPAADGRLTAVELRGGDGRLRRPRLMRAAAFASSAASLAMSAAPQKLHAARCTDAPASLAVRQATRAVRPARRPRAAASATGRTPRPY
jgi:hypothetical protein